MTREELEELLGESWEESSKAKSLYISSLEEHIAELESYRTCKDCQYENLDRYGDNHCKFKDICMRSFYDYYKAKEN
jgi:deoxyribodipyrimidine photolyase-like uncharacterized protein